MYLKSSYLIIMEGVKALLFRLWFHQNQDAVNKKDDLSFTILMYLLNL